MGGRKAPARLTTIKATAERYGTTQHTIRCWIADGILTAYRIGPRMVRLDADEVDAMIRPIPTAGSDRA